MVWKELPGLVKTNIIVILISAFVLFISLILGFFKLKEIFILLFILSEALLIFSILTYLNYLISRRIALKNGMRILAVISTILLFILGGLLAVYLAEDGTSTLAKFFKISLTESDGYGILGLIFLSFGMYLFFFIINIIISIKTSKNKQETKTQTL